MMFEQTRRNSGVSGWQEVVSAAYFPLVAKGRHQGDFHGTLDIWNMGVVSATRIICDAVLYRRETVHLREERESSVLISIPSHAEVTFRQHGQQAKCAPGGLVIERSDAPYEYWHAKPDVQWVVKLPRGSVQDRIGRAEKALGLCIDARSGLAAYFLSSLRAAVTHAPDMPESGRAAAGMHLLDILCLALRADVRALDSGDTAVQQAHLDRAELFISDHLRDPDLTTDTVAAACGISARYLQRLFAKSGRTVSGYLRDCRLMRCHEDLRRGQHAGNIATLAYRWGFTDHAQFSRLYRAKFRSSPRERRAMAKWPDA